MKLKNGRGNRKLVSDLALREATLSLALFIFPHPGKCPSPENKVKLRQRAMGLIKDYYLNLCCFASNFFPLKTVQGWIEELFFTALQIKLEDCRVMGEQRRVSTINNLTHLKKYDTEDVGHDGYRLQFHRHY